MRDEDPRSKYQDPTLKIQVLNGKEALKPKNMRMTRKTDNDGTKINWD
jgi:hypothetical protein